MRDADGRGATVRLRFDTDKGGTTNLRQKAVRQWRDAVANDVYRAVCDDTEHMNKTFPSDPQLNFPTDFGEDCTQRRAAELLERDREEDEANY